MSQEPTSDVPGFSSFERYRDSLMAGTLDDWTQKEIAAEFSVTDRTVRNWERKVDWEAVRREAAKRRDRDGFKIDRALVRKALAGDVRAIELWKQTADGWVPESRQTTLHDLDESAVDAELEMLLEQKRAVRDVLANTNDALEPHAGSETSPTSGPEGVPTAE